MGPLQPEGQLGFRAEVRKSGASKGMGTLASASHRFSVDEGGVNVCDFEKRISSECGDVRCRGRLSFLKLAGASRQPAGPAAWMPDVAGERNDRQRLSRHDQATRPGRISDD